MATVANYIWKILYSIFGIGWALTIIDVLKYNLDINDLSIEKGLEGHSKIVFSIAGIAFIIYKGVIIAIKTYHFVQDSKLNRKIKRQQLIENRKDLKKEKPKENEFN